MATELVIRIRTRMRTLSSWLGFCFVDSITIVTWFNATRIAAECGRKVMRFDMADCGGGWSRPNKITRVGPTISCSIVDNQSPPPTPWQHAHTLSLIAKRGQCDFKPQPQPQSPQPYPNRPRTGPTKLYLQKKKPKNQEKIVETRISIVAFVATFSFVSLLLFISLACLGVSLSLRLSVCLSVCLAFWPPRQLCSASVARPFCSDY